MQLMSPVLRKKFLQLHHWHPSQLLAVRVGTCPGDEIAMFLFLLTLTAPPFFTLINNVFIIPIATWHAQISVLLG